MVKILNLLQVQDIMMKNLDKITLIFKVELLGEKRNLRWQKVIEIRK